MLRNSLFILDCCWRCSITKSSQTLCDPTDCSTPDFSWSLLRFMSIELVVPSSHLILCHPLLLLPSIFPSIRVFSKSCLSASGGQSIEALASASALPTNIQGWFPLGLAGLILQSKVLNLGSSLAPQFENVYSSVLSLLCGLTFTSVHDYWKNHSFDYMDCRQSDVSDF